ncbi:MAG: single-stranded-DNA-specific exonuclease RecJ, partial [Pseudomonadota bacterium]
SINLALAKEIEQIGPFGGSNHEPRFIIKNAFIAKVNIFGESHITCFIGCSESKNLSSLLKVNAFRAIDTDLGNHLLKTGNVLDIIGYLRINRWKGRETPEFIIEDVIPT